MIPRKGFVFSAQDVTSTIGLSCASKLDVPPPMSRVETVFYYGRFDLPALRKSKAGLEYMCQGQDWYDTKEWTAEPGYYRIALSVPCAGSHGRYVPGKLATRLLGQGWSLAPVCVAVAALLLHFDEANLPFLGIGRYDTIVCGETHEEYPVTVAFEHRQIFVCIPRRGFLSWGSTPGRTYMAFVKKC